GAGACQQRDPPLAAESSPGASELCRGRLGRSTTGDPGALAHGLRRSGTILEPRARILTTPGGNAAVGPPALPRRDSRVLAGKDLMKLLRYGPKGQEKPGLLDAEGKIRDLSGHIADLDGSILADSQRLASLAALDPAALPVVDSSVRLAEPVARVGKFLCIGLNYSDHAAEAGAAVPEEPILFTKATSSIIGPNDDVVLPPASTKSDWEVELGVVIGKEARYVPVEQALEHVAGFCVVNDLSEREYQLERAG